MLKTKDLRARRRQRTRYRVKLRGQGRLRLSVFRSLRHISAQVIDDKAGRTLAAASSLEKDVSAAREPGDARKTAQKVGELVAQRAHAAGVKSVVFDRGGYKFHGRVKALADAAREAGLQF